VATIAIKGKTSSSKSLFPKPSKHTCFMAKEGRKKVKSNTSSSPKYVTCDEDTPSSDNYDSSDDDNPLPSELVKNPNAIIKGLMMQVGARDELLEQQEELLVQERKISEELKKLLALEKGKVEKLDQELAKSKENTCSLKSSIGALQGQHDVLLKTHQDLKMQFGALWSSTSKTSTNDKASTSRVNVETCDDQIGQENDHFKREVKKLELEVNKLKNQAKVQTPQDNRSNVVKKLNKGKTSPKIASQPSKKQVQNEKDDKVEYARSVFLNARRPHIKSGIGYKNGDKHNSRVNTKGQKFIKFTKANVQQEQKQSIKTTINASYPYTNASHVSHMS
jgi:cytochrome c556